MTVETTARKQNFAGGQATLNFTFTALPESPQDIKALAIDSNGAETELVYGAGYSVVVATDGIGGVVTLNPTYSTSYTHTVYRLTTKKQESDYDDYNAFPADTLETNLDRLTMIVQEIGEDINRVVKLPISSTTTDITLPEPDEDKILQWGADGNLQNAALLAGPTGPTGPQGPAGTDGIFSAIASQAEAEVGTENTKGMTPLRTSQAITALANPSIATLTEQTALPTTTSSQLKIFSRKSGRTFFARGNAQIDTAQKKFGTGSLVLDGTGDYLETPYSSSLDLGTAPFTIDFWYRATAFGTASETLFMQDDSIAGGNNYVQLIKNIGTDKIGFYAAVGGTAVASYNMSNSWANANNTWYHIEFVRNGTNVYLFIDGVSQTLTETTAISTNSLTLAVNPTTMVGGYSSNGVIGNIDEFRLSVGVARHTSNFTPPTAEYTSDQYTQILLHFNDNDGETTVFDEGVTATLKPFIRDASSGTVNPLLEKLGTYAARTSETVYLAEEDGFFIVHINTYGGDGVVYASLKSDSSNPPTTIITYVGATSYSATAALGGATIPVKKGNYYVTSAPYKSNGSATVTVACYFIPVN